MNSERGAFIISSFAQPGGAASYRLHSRLFTAYSRGFALLLGLGLYPVLGFAAERAVQVGKLQSLVEGALLTLGLLGVAAYLWLRPTVVIATPAGLQVGSGKKRRLIPWARVLDVRELPWLRFSLSWYPAMWQVDLAGGRRFDFCGTRRARDIVKRYIERAEAAAVH